MRNERKTHTLKRKTIIIISILALILVGVAVIIIMGIMNKKGNTDNKQGAFAWTGCYRVIKEDGSNLQLSFDKETQIVKISSTSGGYANNEISSWKCEDENITIAISKNSYYDIYQLAEDIDGNLAGTNLYMGEESPVTFEKYRDEPNRSVQNNQDMKRNYAQQLELINSYSEYEEDGLQYDFSYDLNKKDVYKKLIKKYNLDEITAGKEDVELMMALMNWLCDTCKHGSSSYYWTDSVDELVSYGIENGLNCRCLSTVLAEVMRAYGIQAKLIWCYPKDDYFDDCHVVVQAYSQEKQQWILFDPTYRLTLQTIEGKYLDVQRLREWIRQYGSELDNMTKADEQYLIANEGAGYTGQDNSQFYLYDYITYMSKNLFRLSCLRNNSTQATKYYKDNYCIELISSNYNKTGIDVSPFTDLTGFEKTIITTDSNHFFEAP